LPSTTKIATSEIVADRMKMKDLVNDPTADPIETPYEIVMVFDVMILT
jgi:hypothetical protein